PHPAVYMEKIIVDRIAGPALVEECLDAPAAWTLALVARVKGKDVRDLVVFILDRPRHRDLIEEVRAAGARVLMRSEGDVAGGLMAASEEADVDILMGIGGVSEGVIAACGVKSLGGAMLGRLAPQTEAERTAIEEAGLDLRKIVTLAEMVKGNEIFFSATGITDGVLLKGVRYHGREAHTESLVLRCETKTRRIIEARHVVV
ncbi:MAG TPA: fructose-bisphosphatase class II, partial [Anaerolineales bacterium]|nr:fructose-bisphosphatase class II [Anaerolineales bacterium]